MQFDTIPTGVACSIGGVTVYVTDRGNDSLYRGVVPRQEKPIAADEGFTFQGVTFASDVLLFQTINNGDIELNNGVVGMTSSFRTAAYLSMFGGSDWWGNVDVTEPARQYNAKTQTLLETLPPSSRNLLRIEEAAKDDLNWFISEGAASSVEAVASIPALNQVRLVISIRAEGQEADFEFTENWKGSV